MNNRPFVHLAAVLQALLVTFLWSTSWVLIKFGLDDLPALTFAGLRYTLAFLCLLPFLLHPARRADIRCLSRANWFRLIVLGLLFYAVTQGAQFVGLAYLPAITVNLLLNFTTVLVAFLGLILLTERLRMLQWAGVGLNVAGLLIFFYPVSFPTSHLFGLAVVCLGVLANAGSALLGRSVNRTSAIHPLTVTVVSMGMGALTLLGAGILAQGLPPLTPMHWALIGWLAIVNTAFAFTLWNHTLRTLSAVESSIINSTMMVQIPILAIMFLDESLTVRQALGMLLAGTGALVVQLRLRTKSNLVAPDTATADKLGPGQAIDRS